MSKADEIILIGGSAGSYNLIVAIIESLPSYFIYAIVVIIHRNPKFVTRIEDTLAARLHRPIIQAGDKTNISKNMIYFAVPGYHLLVEPDRTFSLDISEQIQFSRPSIDVLFETAAEIYGKRCSAFLLSGANKDGTDGIRIVQKMGGKAFVQSPEEARMRTMPESAIRANQEINIFTDQEIISYFRDLK
ncbi:chemotaxis protein CheB [Sphingobacterium paludis]|jgi:two-component system, chemotaxis family, protein-glutamate methylesterase/glutaminase|uniref:protein-glutamate methylesterase n=1 Tax=Sphingobacterium paludis TaxID=1476465 RepID=A0A4V3E251_9SPHI|nr:chemotaxis protein CheB [Sphingobacterium paludis]TDS15878.1 two-component system chemotaxis response regulator CheB [Sphingobacterium paludis]